MNNPFDYTPDEACDKAFHELLELVDTLKNSRNPEDVSLCRELESGKMLGVLIAADEYGDVHKLYAFSGQLGERGFHHPCFVGPVFDYLEPGGHFKTTEAEITRLNEEIKLFESTTLSELNSEFRDAEERTNAIVNEYRAKCHRSKQERDLRRASGDCSPESCSDMIRQSQFEKAELKRLKKRCLSDLEPFRERLKEAEEYLAQMKSKRHAASEALQQWLFTEFRVMNALGESKSLSDIFSTTALKTPPSGAGECCAPKLLQAAYIQGLTPLSMAEYWYGRPKDGEVRIHGKYYPACRGKCLPVLGWMLRGLEVTPPLTDSARFTRVPDPEIIFENDWFCVVNKPSGMLSVPGKGNEKSLQHWLEEKYVDKRNVRMVHRLDQDTSGLIVASFGNLSYKVLQSLFATRKVKKTYIAELEGNYENLGLPRKGRIMLPLSPDWLDRPRQRVDLKCGKEAVTDYEFTGTDEDRSRVIFHPHTGRTHQLRVHAASSDGLGMPIAGDRLYGTSDVHNCGRMLLHAHRLDFMFPVDGRKYSFCVPAPF